MKLLKLIMILTVLTISLAATGCNPLDYLTPKGPMVHFKRGDVAELAEPVKVKVWVTNKETGKLEKRPAMLHPHYMVGREK